MSLAYRSEDCRAFAKALELAWEIFLRTGRLTSQNIDVAKAALSYSIFEAAENGQRNPRILAIAAVACMANHEARIKRERSWHRSGHMRGNEPDVCPRQRSAACEEGRQTPGDSFDAEKFRIKAPPIAVDGDEEGA
jgi:hypothetical protein